MRQPKLVIEHVFEDEVGEFDFPVYLSGYDPYSNQNFRGRFLFSKGILEPVKYETTNNQHLSGSYYTHAVAWVAQAEREYRSNK